ncbi:protein SCAF11 isoform X2 [Engystomops pustulosus]|uniref:protein SCAF11 isoform X2 n=1 Tax=Engystomops pustulosus TaxID=76066 RepID=UPI003AFA69D1
MKNKSLCSSSTRNDQHKEKDGEENGDGGCASPEILSMPERCPICLNILSLEVGFPEQCCHAFCISCILKWSETSTSCPVDRKPFQAIYKMDSIGSWIKISVKERRPEDKMNCVCEQTLSYCAKGKLCLRICMKAETSMNTRTPKDNDCLAHKEEPEMETMQRGWRNCFTGDVIASCPSNLSETSSPWYNRTEENEVCLIRQKRESLKHLRIPLGVDAITCNSSLPADILIYQPLSLDEYILPLSPISLRSEDNSSRMCPHTGAQEGTEKKQAASGTSTNRGTRKKSVQSSTRRRSTRNSKSDTSNLQSSPKSSGSDHDTPGNATAAANAPSSDRPGKQTLKQRKQTPKKGSQARKRLRSATPLQDEPNDDKESSESEPEQEKKYKMSDDLSETELYKTNQSPNSSNDKKYEHSDPSSPLEQPEKPLLSSSPAHNLLSVDEESLSSPDLQNKHQSCIEHSSPSPVFNNGQNDLEGCQVESPKSVNEPSSMGSAENQMETNKKCVLEAENVTVSGRESSPASANHVISDDGDLAHLSCDKEQLHVEDVPSSPLSCTEMKSPREDLQNLPSEEITVNEESQLHSSQIDLQSNERDCENMDSNTTQSTLPPDLGKPYDLDCTPPSPDASDEQSTRQPPDLQLLSPDDSLETVERTLEQEKVEGNLQVEKPEECIEEQNATTNTTPELKCHNSDSSDNSLELSKESLTTSTISVAEESLNTDTKASNGNTLCIEEVKSSILRDSKITETDEKKALEKPFCDDIEPVAMECDLLCSDHNDSEIEKPVDPTEANKTESDLAEKKELQTSPKQSLPPNDIQKKESRTRKSRFHSPSTTWSPSKNEVKERPRSRSRSKVKDSPVKRKTRSRSREKEGEHGRGGQWKGRSRDRHHRRHSRSRSRHSRSRSRHSRSRSRHSRSRSRHSKSKSRSRSRSGSRSKYRNRNEKDCSSPPWKERHISENWKSPRGSEKLRRNEHEKHESFRNEKYDSRDSAEAYPDNKNDYPDWVVEKMKSVDNRGRGDTWMRGEGRGRGDRGWGETRGRGDRARGRGDFRGRGESRGRGDRGRGGNRGRGSHWDDDHYGSGDSWNRNANMDWNSPRSRGGRGRGGFRGGFNYGDQNENNWNNRQPFSGNSITSGQESSRFPESKMKPKYEDSYDAPADRSGWSSASSWAVRKTLPADVQNYYSKRGRNSSGSQGSVWPKPEETSDQDQAAKDQASQQTETTPVPVNMVQTQMNVVQQPIAAPPQPMNMFPYPVGVHPPLVNIQHNPFNLHPPLPIHLHPALPLVQVSAPSSVPQGLPPPPPPPPPSQQMSYIAPPQDGKPLQKILIQERAAQEVKVAIKQYYQNKDITKDEYKEIVKKAVDKVCHSKSGEVDSAKVANLVKAYVDKYKHSRKKGTDDKL